MAIIRCPGQDTGFWDFNAIYDVKCPKCGYPVEFFKDEPTRICKRCGYEFVNPKMDFGCAAYCKYADQCLGSLPTELITEREELFKDRLAIEVKKHLANNFKMLNRVLKRTKYIEEIIKEETANPAVLLSASYFYNLGSTIEENQTIAKEILKKLNAKEEMIIEVCELLKGNKQVEELSLNYKILLDADRLTDLELELKEKSPNKNKDEIYTRIDKEFFTEVAKKIAKRLIG